MSSDELISREEVLTGLPARRANTLLFLIESRTAHIVARSRVEFSLTELSANERDLAFLEAFALGNAPPLHPTIQDLERYARQWTPLVPSNPRLKAAVAHALSQKYNFTYQAVPSIRTALGLDEKAVQQAYHRLYHLPLETVFASQLPLTEQLRWTSARIAQRLESLPPFWIASLVTVALGLPQAFLALPIAMANVGPLATLAIVIVIGTINIVTMACMAEAIGRSGDFRYGNAFIKQLAGNYLGTTGSFLLSLAVGIRVFLIALACYIGLSATMASFTRIPAQLWAAFLFLTGIYLLSRKSLNFTVSVMVMLAAINVSLLLLLSLLAFPHVQPSNLLYVNLPFLDGRATDPQMLGQVFGVSLMLYFGHVYVGECAKLVLPRDPSAASLIWGSVAGTAFLTFLFCIWVLAINGAIAPEELTTQSGTVLEPLAKQVGPIVKVLGSVLVALLLGMAWIRSSSLLINLAREWLGSGQNPILMLPSNQGRLILYSPRGNPSSVPRIGITYLGLEEKKPRFRLDVQSGGGIHHVQITVTERWQISELFDQFPNLRQRGIYLTLEVRAANRDNVCLKVTSSMVLTYEGLQLSSERAEPLSHHRNAQPHKVQVKRVPISLDMTSGALETTTDAGNTSPKRKIHTSGLAGQAIALRLWAALLKQRRFLLSISPLVLVFLLTEWLFFAGTQSFTSVLAFAGVLGNSLVGGIFPVLLLISSRRKGELVPGVVFQLLNNPFLLTGIYGLFLAILFLHGLFIWENPFARISAFGVATLSLAATLIMGRSGAFTPRTVVELRQDQQEGERTILTITAGGRPKTASVRLGYADCEQHYQATTVEVPSLSSLRYATLQLPTKRREELRVWAHRGKPNGDSESLPAFLEVHRGDKTMQFDLKLSGGKVLLPLISDGCCLKITLPELSLSPGS